MGRCRLQQGLAGLIGDLVGRRNEPPSEDLKEWWLSARILLLGIPLTDVGLHASSLAQATEFEIPLAAPNTLKSFPGSAREPLPRRRRSLSVQLFRLV
jgi:hypothetical protein